MFYKNISFTLMFIFQKILKIYSKSLKAEMLVLKNMVNEENFGH